MHFTKLMLLFFATFLLAQEKGHYNNTAFKQLDQELPTPNMFRTAAGAPGPNYYQQRADYKMDITLDDANAKLYGEEEITYTNHSPDVLEYLWVQLDQNVRKEDSPSNLISQKAKPTRPIGKEGFSQNYLEPNFDGGFNLDYVKDMKGKDLSYTINQTMMRINLKTPLKPGEVFKFKIKWWCNIIDHLKYWGRSGYEYFPKDGNKTFQIAQFFPRMAVYNDVYGWQNMQFWGRSEFALPFGDYEVNITVPADHILNGTGEITNLDELLTKTQKKRLDKAWKSYKEPVIIVTQQEAEKAEKSFSKKTKTWKLKAENVRDFAFSTSRKYIWDAMAVKLDKRTVLATSLYPKEGNPLWEKYSTKVVAHTLNEYSKYTFDYPYHKAISVHAKQQGMEYPMICWNFGRPNEDGTYSDRTKYRMIGVIIHEIGHNFFPMIVNSDERRWTWMDEGLNTFLQFLTEQNFQAMFPTEFEQGKTFPSRRGFPKDIVDYMSLNQDVLMPIMTHGDQVYNFGANAYGKPATGLSILRHTVMGTELFDYAFKTFANRWKFKHPTPADFFRTMEDASGVDLDWFWRGWFYTTNYTDIGVKSVEEFYLNETGKQGSKRYSFDKNGSQLNQSVYNEFKELKEYTDQLPKNLKEKLKDPRYFYEIEFEKPGNLIMPLLVKFVFDDGTEKEMRYPYMIWRLNESGKKMFYGFDKKLAKVIIDEKLETADVNMANNFWPTRKVTSEFDQFKNQLNK